MNQSIIWGKIKKQLKKNQPSHAYSTWFEPISPIAFNNNTLVLELPNQFFFEWIQTHYKDTILKTGVGLINDLLEIKYTVSPESQKISEAPTKDNGFSKNNIPTTKQRHPQINPQYTLKSFIEGKHNEFARAAAKNVSKTPGQQAFNPLVIYGGVGMGKTHLLHGIGNKIIKTNPAMKVVCASSEKFTIDFISSIQKNRTVEFSKIYRAAD